MHWIDPESLPELAGTVERFVLNARGEIDGFVMKDQAQAPILVHTPPHMGDELTRHVKASEKVEGKKDEFFALEKDLVDVLIKTLYGQKVKRP